MWPAGTEVNVLMPGPRRRCWFAYQLEFGARAIILNARRL